MRFLFFAIIALGITTTVKAQMPIKTSDPAASQAATAATLPLRTSDNAAKTNTRSVAQAVPVRTTDNTSKTGSSAAVQELPIRNSDPGSTAASPASNASQKTATQQKPVLPSEQPVPADNSAKQTTQPAQSTIPKN